MIGVAIVDCTASAMLTPAQLERTSSSPQTAVYHQSPPEPPTSSGYEAPRKPISPRLLEDLAREELRLLPLVGVGRELLLHPVAERLAEDLVLFAEESS